jgi:hypothetical protein
MTAEVSVMTTAFFRQSIHSVFRHCIFRIYDMNKRLQQRTEESDNLWWDAFATEFFEDDATLSLSFCLGQFHIQVDNVKN